MVTDIPDGSYRFTISAPGHTPYSGSFTIEPAMTVTVPIALEVDLIDIDWSVTPVLIEDRYDITVTQTFETKVPAPVLVIEPGSFTVPPMEPGEVYNGEFTVSNYGLIRMFDVVLEYQRLSGEYELEILEDAIPDALEAMQSVTVPFRVTRMAATAGGGQTASIASEVTGYGGGDCQELFPISIKAKCEVCPGSEFARIAEKAANILITVMNNIGMCSAAENIYKYSAGNISTIEQIAFSQVGSVLSTTPETSSAVIETECKEEEDGETPCGKCEEKPVEWNKSFAPAVTGAKLPTPLKILNVSVETKGSYTLKCPYVCCGKDKIRYAEAKAYGGGSGDGGGGGNSAPVASAGPDQNVTTGALVTLDGSGSSDADGDTLTYSWSFTSTPSGSSATLSDYTAVNPTFTADLDGTYVLSLTVNDGTVDSAADTVTVTAATGSGSGVGGTFPIATTSEREYAFSAAFDGTNFLVGIQNVGSGPFEVNAQLIDQNGSPAASLLSTGRTGGAPIVAFGGTNYFMAWSDDATYPNKAIYGQLISTAGAASGSPFAISTILGNMSIGLQGVSAISTAAGARTNGYGAIWVDNDTKACYSRDINMDGSFPFPNNPEDTMAQGTAAGDPGGQAGGACGTTSCLAAWDTGSDIRIRVFISNTAATTSVLATKDQECNDWNPIGVRFDGTNYLVVWNDHSDCADPPPRGTCLRSAWTNRATRWAG